MQLSIKVVNLLAITSVLLVSCQKNDDDQGRPYEFGFTIDGQQHRHEKKDTKGIIEGEFGFITADGIYHVTVYATDENGNFKILSMRNVRISAPLDGSPLPPGAKIESVPGVSAPQPQSPQLAGGKTAQPPVGVNNQNSPLPLPLSYPNQVNQQDISITTTSRPNGRYAFTTQPTIKPACGGCGYVTTAKPKAGEPKFPFQTPQFQQKPAQPQNYPETLGVNVQHNGGSNIGGNPQAPFVSSINSGSTSDGLNPSGPLGSITNSDLSNPAGFSGIPSIPSVADRAGNIGSSGNPGLTGGTLVNAEIPQVNANPLSIESPKIPSNQPVNSPPSRLSQVTVSDGAIHVPGQDDIKIRDKYPGMADGLPAGVKATDITDLLYQFHYEVGFHGHYEKGTKSGAKIGGYFVNGRDGISRVVTYVADENGFQPKVKFIRLGLDSPDTPKPDNEKTFGLKSFEFIWYPVD